MAISNLSDPIGGRAIINDALAKRLSRHPNLLGLDGAPTQIGSGIPVYSLTRNAAASEDPVGAAIRMGWCFLIVGSGLGLATLTEDTGMGQHFAGIMQGVLPQRLVDAAQLAEANLANEPEVFEPRLLECPPLHIYCLWFKGSQTSRFISLMDGRPPGSAPLTIESDILPLIRSVLSGRNPRRPRSAGGSPTN
jgi:hypothetical protein